VQEYCGENQGIVDRRLMILDLWKSLSAVVATMAKSARSTVLNNKIKN
jgi:hypothetical protein